MISEQKKEAIRNLYLSGVAEEFIAMQVDVDIHIVIDILKELRIYKSDNKEQIESNLIQ